MDDVGKVIHGSSGVSRYNGIAREARILFTDVGDDFTGAIDTTLFSLADVHAWAYQVWMGCIIRLNYCVDLATGGGCWWLYCLGKGGGVHRRVL